MHLGDLSEEDRHGQVDRSGLILGVPVHQHQTLVFNSLSNNRVATTLALSDLDELLKAVGRDCHHVAFLSFAAPDLERAQAPVGVVNFSEFEASSKASIFDELGKSVG